MSLFYPLFPVCPPFSDRSPSLIIAANHTIGAIVFIAVCLRMGVHMLIIDHIFMAHHLADIPCAVCIFGRFPFRFVTVRFVIACPLTVQQDGCLVTVFQQYYVLRTYYGVPFTDLRYLPTVHTYLPGLRHGGT